VIGLLARATLRVLILVFLSVIVVDSAQAITFLSNRSITAVRYSYLLAVLIYVMSDDQTSFSLLKVNALSSLFSGTVSFLASVMYDFYLLDQGKIVQCSFRWLPVILILISVLAHAKYLPHALDGITVFVLSYKFKFHLRLTEEEAAGVLQYLPFQLYF
jgi:hypothetical protein